MSERFQVDLHGVVDLLSRHLYSSPKVFVRELAQNAVDAVTARGRRDDDPRPAAELTVHADGVVECRDSGVGLTPAEMETFLATIGNSSKRDELGLQREDLLGQFGIGLLSAFMVAEQVEVVSRSASLDPEVALESLAWWTGNADGTYRVTTGPGEDGDDRLAWLARGPGTCVRLVPRAEARSWTTASSVLALARTYLSFLPHTIVVKVVDGAGEVTVHHVSPQPAPWSDDGPGAAERLGELLGVSPFATLPLNVPEAGLRGVAVVASTPLGSLGRSGHRVHLRGMLLGEDVAEVAPSWATFCRVVADASLLKPTASREQLYDDELTELTRRAVGEQLMRWLTRLSTTDPDRMRRFLSIHHLALKSAAVQEDSLLDLVAPLLPFETTRGTATLAELTADGGSLAFVGEVDAFRRVSTVAGAQGLTVVNAGYVYDAQILRRWADRHPGTTLTELLPQDLDTHLDPVDAARERAARPFLDVAEAALAEAGIAVVLRRFAPENLTALLLDDHDLWRERDRQATAATADDVFAALLAGTATQVDPRPRLVLNDAHPAVRRVVGLGPDDARTRLAVHALYARALLAGRHPVRPVDTVIVETSFSSLLDVLLRDDAPSTSTPSDPKEHTA